MVLFAPNVLSIITVSHEFLKQIKEWHVASSGTNVGSSEGWSD